VNGASIFNGTGIDLERVAITNVNDVNISQLQQIVDDNRAHGIVTILDCHQWGTGNDGGYTGVDPQSEWWYNDYKNKLGQIAAHFANQSDAWIETWNEPYQNGDQNQASGNERWVGFEKEAIGIIREAGNNNIIVVNAPNWGADDGAIVAKGNEILNGQNNILFDLHGYDGMDGPNNSEQSDENKIRAMQNVNEAVLIGETGPSNNDNHMDPTPVLDAVRKTGVSITAWCWGSGDGNRIAAEDGSGRTNWGNQYISFAQESHTVPGGKTNGSNNSGNSGPLYINAGGSSFKTSNGTNWVADEYFDGGNTADRGNITVQNDTTGKKDWTEHWGMNGYHIPLPNGTYNVTLDFAETYTNSGLRCAKLRQNTYGCI